MLLEGVAAHDPEPAAQRSEHAGRDHDQPRFDDGIVGQNDLRALGIGSDVDRLPDHERRRTRELGPNDVDEILVEDPVMRRVGAVDDPAVTGIDHLLEPRRRRGDAIEQPEPAQQLDLLAGELLDPELRRIGAVSIDQRNPVAGARENDRGERSAQPGADDRDVGRDHR